MHYHQSSTIEQLFDFIEERFLLWERKAANLQPWTEDPILAKWRFPNILRVSDPGTWAIYNYIDRDASRELMLFNIVWYRLFNNRHNVNRVAFVRDYDKFRDNMILLHEGEFKLFSNAYRVMGKNGEEKVMSVLDTLKDVWERKEDVINDLDKDPTTKNLTTLLTQFDLIGPFVAYEMACDACEAPIFKINAYPYHPSHRNLDRNDWCFVSMRAQKALQRLGMLDRVHKRNSENCVPKVKQLLDVAINYLPAERFMYLDGSTPSFNMAAMSRSLAEFDKYCDIKQNGNLSRLPLYKVVSK